MLQNSDTPVVKAAFIFSFGFGSWATWALWIQQAGSVAGNLVPVVTCLVLLATLYTTLFPRKHDDVAPAEKALGVMKKAGVAAGIMAAIIAALYFWKREAKATATLPQALIGSSARKRSADDETEDDEPGNGSDIPPIVPGAPAWYTVAARLIGTQEALPNGRKNPVVCAMFSAVNGFDPATVDSRKVPWCAVFVNYCLQNAGVPGTRSAMARSFSERPKLFKELDAPRLGCIVVLSSDTRGPAAGHVTLYGGPGKRPGTFRGLGGNQSDGVCFSDFSERRVVGYYWPRKLSESRTARANVATIAGAGTGAVATGAALATDDTPSKAETAVNAATKVGETLERVQVPLESTGHPKLMRIAMYIGFAVLLITVATAGYALWRQYEDHKSAAA